METTIWNPILDEEVLLIESVADAKRWESEVRYWFRPCAEPTAQDWKESHVLFRGQSNCEWKLEPKVFRAAFRGRERYLYDDFNSGAPDEERLPNTFDMLCKMQHHGLPTRLLDWSSDVLVALYFAVRDTSGGVEDLVPGRLFAFDALGCNVYLAGDMSKQHSFSIETACRAQMVQTDTLSEMLARLDGASVVSPDAASAVSVVRGWADTNRDALRKRLSNPIAVMPEDSTDARIKAQKAAFTLHGGKFYEDGAPQDGFEKPNYAEADWSNFRPEPMFTNVDVACHAKESIRMELAELGIDEYSLFPDLDHLADMIQLRHKKH